MECKKCGEKFKQKKGLKNYCSLKCRNSREWSNSDKLKKSVSAKNSSKVTEMLKKRHLNNDWELIAQKRKESAKNAIMNEDYENLSYDRLRKRIIYDQDEKCGKCGRSEWLGIKLSFEIDHINGDNLDNVKDNLIALCPNCHSITDTWRGRNKKRKTNTYKVSDEKLLEALKDNIFNMRQALIKVGLSPKGGNYKRCHRLKREYKNLMRS